jgi:ABC-type nitrate/sulfonate/bicarbonate transport system substrate-binding protein
MPRFRCSKRGELNAIATVAYTGRTGCIEVKKGSGFKSLEQLKGKRIGTRTGSTIDSVMRSKVLPAFHLKESDFQLVNLDFKDQAAALGWRIDRRLRGCRTILRTRRIARLFRTAD